MSFFRKNTQPAKQADNVPAGLVDLTKKAAVSLDKAGLTGQRAAVYLVLDHSGSMDPYYRDGSVQRLAEQTLALAVNLDDDGTVPVMFFHHDVDHLVDVRLDNYAGLIEREHRKAQWGGTNYAPAMYEVAREHKRSGAADPALVVFQTDGAPGDQDATVLALRDLSGWPVFFAFVGYGPGIRFLERLDDLGGRRVDNASFFHAMYPKQVSDEALLDGITREYGQWLTAAARAGIIR